MEWTPFGVQSVKQRGFTYLSAEYHEAWTDNEKKQQHGCVLLGAGLTNRPVISRLDGIDPKQLSQDDNDHDTPVRVHRSLGNMLRSSLWDNLEVSLWSSLRYSLEQTAQNAQSVEETNDA